MPAIAQVHRDVALRVLGAEGGIAGDAHLAADAAARVFDKLSRSLTPMIGSEGVRVVLARAIVVSGIAFDALPLVARTNADVSAALRRSLVSMSNDAALGEAVAVYAALFALLTSFVGGELVSRVLRAEWPDLDVIFKENP